MTTPMQLLKLLKDATSDSNHPSIVDIADAERFLIETLETDISDSEKELIEETLEVFHNLVMIFVKFDYHHQRSERLKVHEY